MNAVSTPSIRGARTMLVLAGLLVAIPALSGGLGGCAIGHLAGAMAQNFEYQKELQVLPKYDLEGKTVAVVVDADMGVLYEHPKLVEKITGGVTLRIGRDVPGCSVVDPRQILAWQWNTPQWNAMPYGEIAESLGVDRVIFIDIYEYRLHPPGNYWLWEGVCAANISVIERDGFDPDMFADTFDVTANFPSVKNVDRCARSRWNPNASCCPSLIAPLVNSSRPRSSSRRASATSTPRAFKIARASSTAIARWASSSVTSGSSFATCWPGSTCRSRT